MIGLLNVGDIPSAKASEELILSAVSLTEKDGRGSAAGGGLAAL